MKWFRGGLVFEAHRLLYHSAGPSRTCNESKEEGLPSNMNPAEPHGQPSSLNSGTWNLHPHPTPYAIRPTPYTLHTTHHTLHTTHYTLHTTPFMKYNSMSVKESRRDCGSWKRARATQRCSKLLHKLLQKLLQKLLHKLLQKQITIWSVINWRSSPEIRWKSCGCGSWRRARATSRCSTWLQKLLHKLLHITTQNTTQIAT